MFIFPINSEKTNAKCLAKAEKKMNTVCQNINSNKVIKRGFNPLSKGLGLIQGAFMPSAERSGQDSVKIDDDCNGCGLCIQICPMHNFRLENKIIIPEGNCTLCFRCINKCPQKAISVYIRKKVKKQYKGL
jgi:ferredoxin